MSRLSISFLLVCIFFQAYSQSEFPKLETELAKYNDYFVNAEKYEHRREAHVKFIELFDEVLNMPGSFLYQFDSLHWISKEMAPDSSFRIFSWQLSDNTGDQNEFFGYIQTKDKLFPLTDNRSKNTDINFDEFSSDNWIGQVYYNIQKFKSGKEDVYILFGAKPLNKYMKMKIAEAVSFKNEKVSFGLPIFEDTDNKNMYKNRIIHFTSTQSASTLNYNSDIKMIIFDHTIQIPETREQGAKMLTIADGSYHGYKPNGNKWNFVDKVFDQIYEKAPELPKMKSDR